MPVRMNRHLPVAEINHCGEGATDHLELLPWTNLLGVSAIQLGEVFPRDIVILGNVLQLISPLNHMTIHVMRLGSKVDAVGDNAKPLHQLITNLRTLPVEIRKLEVGFDIFPIGDELIDGGEIHGFTRGSGRLRSDRLARNVWLGIGGIKSVVRANRGGLLHRVRGRPAGVCLGWSSSIFCRLSGRVARSSLLKLDSSRTEGAFRRGGFRRGRDLSQ